MKSIIGIPRGLLYYRYSVLWKTFFDVLEVPYIVSESSNHETLEKGKNLAIDETCLSLKLFLGQVEQLKDKCDILFIPRIYSLRKNEQVCTNFNALYDLIHTIFPDKKILNYNVDVERHHSEKKAFILLGKELGFSYFESNNAYHIAKEKEKLWLEKLAKSGMKKLKSKKKKVLLLGHTYNILDPLIGGVVTRYLKTNDIEIIYANEIGRNIIDSEAKRISKSVHWTMNKELLGAFSYYKDKVDGTILISAFPCGPDSLTNEMILRKKENSKVLLLTFEEVNSNIAIITRLESFVDMLKGGIHL